MADKDPFITLDGQTKTSLQPVMAENKPQDGQTKSRITHDGQRPDYKYSRWADKKS